MNVSKEMLGYLKEKGVSADILLGMLLDDNPMTEAESPAAEEPRPEEPKPAEPAKPAKDDVLAAIEKLTGAVQAMNVRARSFEPQPAQSVDEILAGVLGAKPEGGK